MRPKDDTPENARQRHYLRVHKRFHAAMPPGSATWVHLEGGIKEGRIAGEVTTELCPPLNGAPVRGIDSTGFVFDETLSVYRNRMDAWIRDHAMLDLVPVLFPRSRRPEHVAVQRCFPSLAEAEASVTNPFREEEE